MPFVVRSLPLLLIPTVLYALLNMVLGGQGLVDAFASTFVSARLPSGDLWAPTWGHVFMLFSALLLFMEIVRSAQPKNSALVENALALLLFTAQLVFFLLVAGFGTMDFAMVMGMTLLDFTAGAMVMIYAARRDVQYNVTA